MTNIYLCESVRRSALLTSKRDLLLPAPAESSLPVSVPTSLTYSSRSAHLKPSGFLASTICTIKCDLSRVLHSCLQTDKFLSKGVSSKASLSSISASPFRHSRKSSRSRLSRSSFVVVRVQPGRRGTRRRFRLSLCFSWICFSSASVSKYGFCCTTDELGRTLIFWRSVRLMTC